MELGIVHVITDLSQINFGIWNAALFNSSFLKEKYGIDSCAVVCSNQELNTPNLSVSVIWAGNSPSPKNVVSELQRLGFTHRNAIVVTHGCWKSPTQLGNQLKQLGFCWVYAPHGMLEPWSLSNHRLKKMIYFYLFERRYSSRADAIRAVSKSEQLNLEQLLKRNVEVVENGVVMPAKHKKADGVMQFLFMARLHFKKGIVPLVKAWASQMTNANARLVIAGPDEGELKKIAPFLKGNIEYVGAVYGDKKNELLQRSNYYVLPSFSEGFPTSVVEAMSYGAIPLISSGCNFPEVLNSDLGFPIEPDEKNISMQLKRVNDMRYDHELSGRNQEFIDQNYSENAIGKKMHSLYQMIKSKNSIINTIQ